MMACVYQVMGVSYVRFSGEKLMGFTRLIACHAGKEPSGESENVSTGLSSGSWD